MTNVWQKIMGQSTMPITKKPGLMLDIDDVIYPFSWALYTELVVHWNYTDDYYTYWRQFDQKSEMYWSNMIRIEPIYGVFPPTPETIELLNDLSREYELYYITSRPKEVELVTRQYFKRYELPNRERIVFSKNKGAACSSLGIDIAVEDQVHNVKNLIASGVSKIYIVRQPWNEHACDTLNCVVVDNFIALRSYLL